MTIIIIVIIMIVITIKIIKREPRLQEERAQRPQPPFRLLEPLSFFILGTPCEWAF